ncbi:hypothetical protein Tco_0545588, partial [Tanacetum coccineum]
MAALKYNDDHNKIAYLGRERGCEDFTDILRYLDHSPLRYALTHAPPVVFDSLVKQFWATAVVRPNAAGSHDLVATIDGHKGKPMKQSEVTHMMRNLVKNQWCAAHNGSLVECSVQRVERGSSQSASVSAATTLHVDDSDSAGGGSSKPAGSATPMTGSAAFNTASGTFGATITDFTVITTAALDPAGSHRTIGVSPFAESAAGGIHEFFL